MRLARLLLFALCLLAVRPGPAAAAPEPEGSALPDAELEGTSGVTHHLSEYLGRVLVLVYEDKHSARQNAALKQAMKDRAQRTNLASQVTFLPIADLDGYSFFAVRPFARSRVRGMAEKFGIEILIDWSGEIAQALGLVPEQSNVLIVDRRGRVVFRKSGALDPKDTDRFFATLDREVKGAG
jgi:predicted transcriptional regulator